jgi:prevent-host-death family protein
MRVDVQKAKTCLSSLVDLVTTGTEVVIAKAGRPVARLVPFANARDSRSGVRLGGLARTRLKLSRDFHEPFSNGDLQPRKLADSISMRAV